MGLMLSITLNFLFEFTFSFLFRYYYCAVIKLFKSQVLKKIFLFKYQSWFQSYEQICKTLPTILKYTLEDIHGNLIVCN